MEELLLDYIWLIDAINTDEGLRGTTSFVEVGERMAENIEKLDDVINELETLDVNVPENPFN